MLEERFSKHTTQILRRAGWFPERHVFSTLILPDGFDLLAPAKIVLDEFGGLSMDFFYSAEFGTNFQRSKVVIDPSLCAKEIESESIAEHSQQIGHPLYPLGIYYDDNWDPVCSTILIDDLGRLFLIAFWTDRFIGETFDIAINNLFDGSRGKPIDQNGHW